MIETPLSTEMLYTLAPGDEIRDPDGVLWRVTAVEYREGQTPRVLGERVFEFIDVDQWTKENR